MTALVSTASLSTVPVSRREEAVTIYLEAARDRLTQALAASGPEAVASIKAEIATAAEATRQLGLSREIQTDAQEMVRRAEFTLGRAIRQGQTEGIVNSNGRPPKTLTESKSFSPSTLMPGGTTTVETYAMADAGPEVFEAALAEAKTEGNVSRANVVRKIRQRTSCGPTPAPTPDVLPPARLEAADRIAMLRDLGGIGVSVEEIAARLGISEARVRQLAREHSIQITAMQGKRRRPTFGVDVIHRATDTVDAATFSLGHVRPQGLGDEGLAALDSLSTSIDALRRAINQIRKGVSS